MVPAPRQNSPFPQMLASPLPQLGVLPQRHKHKLLQVSPSDSFLSARHFLWYHLSTVSQAIPILSSPHGAETTTAKISRDETLQRTHPQWAECPGGHFPGSVLRSSLPLL